MTAKNYTASFTVDHSPDDVFAAINNVRGWWSGEIDGRTDKRGADFTYRYQDLHRNRAVQRPIAAWHVLNRTCRIDR